MRPTPKSSLYWVWMLPVLLLTTALIAHHLTTDVYWFDELANLRKMGVSPYPSATIMEIINNVGVTKWPPAYNFLLLAWGQLVGWSEFATRSLSLLMGVLSVAMMFRIGTRFANRQVGIVSACLLGTSVFFIFYAHEVRGYIQYLLLTIIVLYLYWKHSHLAHLNRKHALIFIISAILLIYTHYVALYVIFAMGIYHLFWSPRQQQWGNQLRWFMFIGVAYLPWVAIAILNAIGETVKNRGLDPLTITQTLLYGFSNGLWFILAGLILYALIFVRNRATTMIAICALIFLGATLITNIATDFLFHIRHIIGLLPMLVLLSAIALHHLLKPTHGLAWLLVIIWMTAGIWFNRDLTFMDHLPGALENRPLEMMSAVSTLTTSCTQADDFVITHLASQQHIWNIYVEQYYLWQPDFTLAMLDTMVDFSDGLDNLQNIGTYQSRLQSYNDRAQHTWVLIADDAYPTTRIDELSTALAQDYLYCDSVFHGSGLQAFVYQSAPEFTCETNTIPSRSLAPCHPLLLSQNNQTP